MYTNRGWYIQNSTELYRVLDMHQIAKEVFICQQSLKTMEEPIFSTFSTSIPTQGMVYLGETKPWRWQKYLLSEVCACMHRSTICMCACVCVLERERDLIKMKQHRGRRRLTQTLLKVGTQQSRNGCLRKKILEDKPLQFFPSS